MEVCCEKSGYHAEIEFLTKPIFGGKAHKITGSIFKSGHKKPIMTLRGEWNGFIYARYGTGDEFLFTDVKEKFEVRKVPPLNRFMVQQAIFRNVNRSINKLHAKAGVCGAT